MRMAQCNNGHYYDRKIHATCPYCTDSTTIENFQTLSRWADETLLISEETYQGEERSNTVLDGVNKIEFPSPAPPPDKMVSKISKLKRWLKERITDKEQKVNNTTMDFRTEKISSYAKSDYKTHRFKKNDLFEKYIIQEIISEGGFSVVYKVKHKYLQHNYALKVFELKFDESEEYIKQLKQLFLQEAKNLSYLNHPNVVKVFDAGVFNKDAYILLEYIDKTRLDLLINDLPYFSFEKILDLLEDIARVLVEQEKMKVIHGDIKPQNIFLRKNNTFCLIDYGNMNTVDIQAYTRNYASPEHITKNITHQSDLFLLGLTAWYCAVGEHPKNLEEWDFKIPSLQDYRYNIPKGLLKIINNLLQIDPSKRYTTAQSLLDDIYDYRYHDEEPVGSIQGTIFVAISYSDEFLPTYNALKRIATSMNLKCIRMDRIHYQDEIWKNIALEIEYSDVIIADFSEAKLGCGANANVVTEAAHARAKGKNIITITQNPPEELPFDWRYIPIVQYSASEEGFNRLSDKITSILRVLINK